MDRGAWWATVHGVAKNQSDTTEPSTAAAWLEVIERQSVEVLQGQWPELKKNRKFSEDKKWRYWHYHDWKDSTMKPYEYATDWFVVHETS